MIAGEMWRFERLDEGEVEELLEAYELGDMGVMIRIINKKKVSPSRLKPCCAREKIALWIMWAKENKRI